MEYRADGIKERILVNEQDFARADYRNSIARIWIHDERSRLWIVDFRIWNQRILLRKSETEKRHRLYKVSFELFDNFSTFPEKLAESINEQIKISSKIQQKHWNMNDRWMLSKTMTFDHASESPATLLIAILRWKIVLNESKNAFAAAEANIMCANACWVLQNGISRSESHCFSLPIRQRSAPLMTVLFYRKKRKTLHCLGAQTMKRRFESFLPLLYKIETIEAWPNDKLVNYVFGVLTMTADKVA